MYAKNAGELVKELSTNEPGQLSVFNANLFSQVTKECDFHFHQLQSLLSKVQEETSSNQTTKNPDHYGALIHHLSLVRNKRCLMSYVYNRAETIRNLDWMIEPPLPEQIQEKLSSFEKDYSKKHSAAIRSYMSDLDLDLAVDMVPPKDPYLKVKVLDDIGSVALSDQITNLAKHSILFLRRTDAETYISQGLMEELTS
ncbi:DNA replication complex GINS protein PSF1-like [Impatiens glandulifera]|uniref:DNA replication complex GINS protein PSF1-like n=1 Tax=Impatiens glandulifera TaxID=253017 RepID=UPI001FB0E525|nr:DNA replication complex GINS protein PSF1-like [Impatiens glandulifera]XP_047312021.1 DNA replication complex GINS protein PSF1-like [Impatiens glandulifera]XP_047312022.1 DNA replication complex GINS protein PSF1-like [Impatiens glandulifera]XP_047312024.1 DNA replication complex GINS protein PSF1-like [Impatiens glandulifera]